MTRGLVDPFRVIVGISFKRIAAQQRKPSRPEPLLDRQQQIYFDALYIDARRNEESDYEIQAVTEESQVYSLPGGVFSRDRFEEYHERTRP